MQQRDSLGYTLMVAAVLCVVCSLAVSAAAVALRPRQEANEKLDQQKNILDATGLAIGEYGIQAGKLDSTQISELNRWISEELVDHFAPGGFSDQYFRGVAGGSGRAVFNTAVCVHPGADETEARQSNANILLSARAEIDTKPELEIYADEVIASHGATVGQLDEMAVFYMRSRGLSEQQARQLLTTAFCRSVSDKLPDQVLGEVISQRMMDVMPQGDIPG